METRRLEDATGLSRGAIFHHFRDKDSLFLAVTEDDAAAIKAVCDVAGGEKKEERGKEEREAGVAEIDCAVCHGVDLPCDGYRLRLSADDAGCACELVSAEVAVGEGFHAAPWAAVRDTMRVGA